MLLLVVAAAGAVALMSVAVAGAAALMGSRNKSKSRVSMLVYVLHSKQGPSVAGMLAVTASRPPIVHASWCCIWGRPARVTSKEPRRVLITPPCIQQSRMNVPEKKAAESSEVTVPPSVFCEPALHNYSHVAPDSVRNH